MVPSDTTQGWVRLVSFGEWNFPNLCVVKSTKGVTTFDKTFIGEQSLVVSYVWDVN